MKFGFPPFQILFFFLFLILPLSSCEQQQAPIKIGLSINLSGRGGEAGEQIRDGALLAVEAVNSAGGIKGRPLELLIRDDKNNAEGVKKADESLMNEDVVAIIGHSSSSNTVTAHPLVTSMGRLLITGYTATTALSAQDDFFLRTSVDCALFGQKAAALLEKKKAHSISILMDMTNAAFVEDYATRIAKHFSGTSTEVKFQSREQADWSQIIDALLAPNPDAIVLLTEASMTGVALQKLEVANFSGPRIATLWTQAPSLMRYAGNSAEGLSIITFINPDNTRPKYLSFAAEIENKFNKKATARSTRAYEIVMILADALKRSPGINSIELKKALLAGEYDTLMGHVRFDSYGDVIRPVYEVVVREKQFRNNGEI